MTKNRTPTLRSLCELAVFLALCNFVPSLAAQHTAAKDGDEELVYAVAVVRHGIRSPTAEPSQYDRFSSAPWPKWPVAPGYLTPHGFEAIKQLGAFDREEFAAHGLLSKKGCEDVSRVSVHADSDQRTRETARALAEGMFPECTMAVREKDEGENDPVFHLPAGSVTAEQGKLGASAVLHRVGGDPANTAKAYQASLIRLDEMLSHCGVETPRSGRTSLLSIPASIAPGESDKVAEMRGPVNTASTLSEILLLEYAEGMPSKDVGWGCVDGAKVRELIDLHTAASELLLRTPAVAAPQARRLLQVIGASLEQAASRRVLPGAEGKPGDKLLMLVGHDTNLTNIAGALQLDWLLDGRRNDTSPGSSLVFELWRDRSSGAMSVRLRFRAQTLEQMRKAEALSPGHGPAQADVFLPGCSRVDGSCSLESFSQLLHRVSISAGW